QRQSGTGTNPILLAISDIKPESVLRESGNRSAARATRPGSAHRRGATPQASAAGRRTASTGRGGRRVRSSLGGCLGAVALRRPATVPPWPPPPRSPRRPSRPRPAALDSCLQDRQEGAEQDVWAEADLAAQGTFSGRQQSKPGDRSQHEA